jgi:hypothetical protein
MRTDPKTALQMQGVLSKQQSDALATQKSQAEAAEAQFKAKSANYKLKSEQLSDWANLAAGITDEQSYYRALKMGVDKGLDVSLVRSMAEGGYDPAQVQQFAKQMLTAKERVELDDLLEKKEFEAKRRPQELKKLENEVANTTRNAEGKLPSEVVAANAPTAEQKNFQAYYETWLESKGLPKNAQNEMMARKDYQQSQRTPVPGVDVPFSKEVQSQRLQSAAAGRAPAVQLTPEALDMAAINFAQTGVMPQMGMGNASARTAIINRAAQIAPNVDLAGNKADYSANTNSLKRLTAQNDSVTAFENTALKNLDTFLNTAKEVLDTGSPMLNRPLRELSDSVVGSEKQAAFNTAKRVAINEIAKVLTNPGSNAALSDSARKEIEELIKPSATLGQIYAAANLLKQDMENRKTSNDEQIKAIRSRIGSGSQPSGSKPKIKILKVE